MPRRLLGLLHGLGDLLGGVGWIYPVPFHGRLVGNLLPAFFVQRLGYDLLSFLQFLGRVRRLLCRRLGLLFFQISLGRVHVLRALRDLLGRLGYGVFDLLADILGLRRQLSLLSGKILTTVGFLLLRQVLGLFANLTFLLCQFAQLLRNSFELADLVTALLYFGHLLAQLFLCLRQRLDGLILLGNGLAAFLLLQCLAGAFHGPSRLVQGMLGLRPGQHRLLLQVFRAFG